MRLGELKGAGRSPELPLLVEGVAQSAIQLQSLLRVLPGQRYVGKALWNEQPVLAKILTGASAQRHFQRELDGAQALAAQGLLTPRLLEHGSSAEGGWLLFEYLDNAQSLADAWRQLPAQAALSAAQQALLGEALAVIAQMHSRGLWQDDLHLDNLMRRADQLYLVDGGGVRAEVPGQALSRDKVLANLGVFFAQLPASVDGHLEELLVHYVLVNGEHALPLEALQKEIAKVRRWRLGDYMHKLGRDCSLFSVQRGASLLRIFKRDEQAGLEPLLVNPDAAIEAGKALKLGGSSTVTQVQLGERKLVVKRYNIKNFMHWLKRFWRPSRAWHSWCEGNRLAFLGIATPLPLAMLELRSFWLRRRAYLITEHLAGEDIISRFEPHAAADSQSMPAESELGALDELFAALKRERISHGDLKGTNILWQENRWALIDLDSMQQHGSERSFAPAFARDRARFLRNWPAGSRLHQLLDQRLPKPGEAAED
ncbi:lipopolysaccharide kinase InaA family protein [Pseudomonas segetis]|uniref:Lipopolysaccharide kinase (Kdo/WaaP) family protein n=1 Tax=Pseudomonas segetis TaxID=298908 RepID=A0A239DNB5_9PSED|nr:lipopolysaccharide kinase InaA family protein [Pseudomonas segetis]SNS33282.1 Lipopolysaccharide kinase (Kdo/WaaP) family protein [Pseudomonas segetis]